jgi:hypothetical protein
MMVRRSEDVHSMDVTWVKWLFMEDSPDKGNADTSGGCNSSHISSAFFFHFSQYANFSKTRPHISRHWFLDIWRVRHLAHLNEDYSLLKHINILLTLCIFPFIRVKVTGIEILWYIPSISFNKRVTAAVKFRWNKKKKLLIVMTALWICIFLLITDVYRRDAE